MLLPTLQKTAIALGLLIGSYLLAALINAAPITQARLDGTYQRGPAVIVIEPERGLEVPPGPGPANAVDDGRAPDVRTAADPDHRAI
jgi:hypothetical protein